VSSSGDGRGHRLGVPASGVDSRAAGQADNRAVLVLEDGGHGEESTPPDSDSH